ncbi:molybdopterin synthase sulfur carrier subunit [Candidatus Fervidibacteria bacterium JGI MDM2 JNZ-1-D12]
MAVVKVRIPAPLQSLTGGATEVEVQGKILREVIDALEQNYAGIKARLCDESGELRRFVNVFVNDQDVRFLQGLDTELKDNDEISIIPAIAGGN